MFNQFDPFRYLYLTIRLKKYVLTTFVVVLFGKLCIGESSSSSTVVKVSDVKGGQCPF